MELQLILTLTFLLVASTIRESISFVVDSHLNDRELELLILHNNDMHARFEQTSKTSGKCLQNNAAAQECYGGFARTAHEVRKYREKAKNGGTPVLYLNAGDTYTGTPWFALFKDNITSAFLNILAPDAISLGNHELDQGVNGLIPFLNAANFPVLASNLDLRKTPELTRTKSLRNSTVFSILGVQVGIIGYLTPDTKFLTIVSDVEYTEEIAAINKEAQKLKEQGIEIILALGHSGFIKDQEIAKNCPEVDIVIGGHTNTFLYNGKQPDKEVPEGSYPYVVTQPNGKRVPVVQAYAYTKYLGKLHVKFDSAGNLISWDGLPILLNAAVPEDSDVLELLNLYRPNITALENQKIGNTKVFLDGKNCRLKECNLGNFIADGMIFSRRMELTNMTDDGNWTDTAIAFLPGGGIRSSIDKRTDGSITMSDVFTVLPFQNELVKVTMSGALVKKALERSAMAWQTDANGAFMQVSGLQVVYNMENKLNERVVSVKALCANCQVPIYSELNYTADYNVIVPLFILLGGDGYNLTGTSNPTKNTTFLTEIDYQAFATYVRAKSPIYPGEEWRIKFITKDEESGKGSANVGTVYSILLLLLSFILFVCF